MLETVVEQEHVRAQSHRLTGRQATDNAGEHRHAGQGFGQEARFVPGQVRIEQQPAAVGHQVHPSLGQAGITAADHRRPETVVLQEPCQVLHHGRLAGAADGEVAHAEHRYRKPVRGAHPPAVAGLAQPHDRPVERGKGPAQGIVKFFCVHQYNYLKTIGYGASWSNCPSFLCPVGRLFGSGRVACPGHAWSRRVHHHSVSVRGRLPAHRVQPRRNVICSAKLSR